MKEVTPILYPHRNRHIYTRRGFRFRLRPRLLADGWSVREVNSLERIYFGIGLFGHLDEVAMYRNVPKCRLHHMARVLKYDRKRPLFELVKRSGLFYCIYDDQERMMGFVSGYCACVMGVIR